MNVVTTQKKIGAITYTVVSTSNEKATDNLKKKIEKMIRKDLQTNIGMETPMTDTAQNDIM